MTAKAAECLRAMQKYFKRALQTCRIPQNSNLFAIFAPEIKTTKPL